MAQPVWVLSVDLQAKTATFASGMSDAAKGGRASLQDIKDAAKDMAAGTNYSMMEARHGVMLLGEEFGFHLPRALTSFIASLGPVGAAMEAAFPFLAIIVGATLLAEHLSKLKEEGDKLTQSQAAFGGTVSRVLGELNDKLLQAGIRTDELNHNHLAALNKQLTLIDHQSLNELVRAFDTLSKSADKTFLDLKTHWFSLSAGSAGAKHALEEFSSKYEELLAKGKEGDATNLLKGTTDQARAFLAEMEAAKGTLAGDDKELTAQRELVDILEAQARAQRTINETKAAEKGNATQAYDDSQIINMLGRSDKMAAARKKAAEEDEKDAEQRMHMESEVTRYFAEEWAKREKLQAEAGKIEAEHSLKMGELQIAAEREAAQFQSVSTLHRLDMELSFAAQEYDLKKQALNKELQALDAHDKEYENKKRALNNKLLELDQQFANQDDALMNKEQARQLAATQAFEKRVSSVMADGFMQVLQKKESLASMMQQVDRQIASEALKSSLQLAMELATVQGRKRFGDARTAAADAWASAGNPITGAIEAAATFAAVMRLEHGGIVPGTGAVDSVPAMLTPGEAVLPKALTDNLMRSGGGNVTHIHIHAPFAPEIHAVDAEGVGRMLKEHAAEFHRHFQNHIRKMNR